MGVPKHNADIEIRPTSGDVGSEGGSPGEVEIARHRGPGVGTEATETWRPWNDPDEDEVRDEGNSRYAAAYRTSIFKRPAWLRSA